MSGLSLHLAPNAPWLILAGLSLAFFGLALWAYSFRLPPLAPGVRRLLTGLRIAVLVVLVWLLALPVLERSRPSSGARVVILEDRSLSMDQLATPGGVSRRVAAAEAVKALRAALRGRAQVDVRGYAAALLADSSQDANERGASAPGDALGELARLPAGRRPDGVILVSDGGVNAGADPVAAARALGVPVHTLLVGERAGLDRGIAGVEASREARVGEATPVRVRVVSDEERGTPIVVKLEEAGRELARATVPAPGPGAEATAELSVVPTRPGLALWTARVAPLERDASPLDDAHGVAIPVAPGKLGVLIVSGGLNWDLAFVRRALARDSTLELDTRVRDASGNWRGLERARGGALAPADLVNRSVVVLDGLSGVDLGPVMDAALVPFVRNGGGLLLLSGGEPGAARFARGRLGAELQFAAGATFGSAFGPAAGVQVAPEPQPLAMELLAWDDDPARGARAWHDAAPLRDVAPFAASAADRVLIAGRDGGSPLWVSRAIGRGQALLVNGSGLWRWSLAGNDDLAGERGRRLWRKTVRWLAEPVQGEPLRVTAERKLVPGGEPVRLDAVLQDARFQPVSGAEVRGELIGPDNKLRKIAFTPGGAGAYTLNLPSPGPGRWQVSVRATRDGRELGRARNEFVVDRWTLEALRAQPDSAAMTAVAVASGGRTGRAADAAAWARTLDPRALVRAQRDSHRLWESPWLFALLVGMLSVEWMWRRRRGLM